MDTLQSESFAKWCCNSRPRSFVVEDGQKFTEMCAAPTKCILTRLGELDPFLGSRVTKCTRRAKRWPLLIAYVSVQQHATGRTVRGSNPGGGEIFGTRPDGLWGLPSLMYNGYRVSLLGLNWPGRTVDQLSPSNTKAKESVELYLYSTSRTSLSLPE